MLADLTEAETLVPSIKAVGFGGRANKSAVRGILARVCLYMAGYPLNDRSKYTDARNWAKKVMDDAEAAHTLNNSYNQVFINLAADKYDIRESLFEVEFWGNRSGCVHGKRPPRFAERHPLHECWIPATASGASMQLPVSTIAMRRSMSAATGISHPIFAAGPTTLKEEYWPESNTWQRSCGKYRRMYEVLLPKSTSFTPINYPILRYSDVLLMFAEADNEAVRNAIA